jgi:hypothetical protein
MKGKRDQNLGREQGDKWAATDLNMVGNGREVFLIKWKIQSKNMIDKRERKRERGGSQIKPPMPLDSLSCRLYNWLHTLLGG